MKNRRSILSLGLLALILVLGVGYAVVSSVDLTIGGTASVAESTLKVSFKDVASKSGENVTAETTDGSLTATIAVTGLTKIGDTATATYTIQNKETDLSAEVLKKSIENDKEDFFEVTTSVDSAPAKIAAGSTETVTVTVKLIKMPILESDSTANITIKLNATPVQP